MLTRITGLVERQPCSVLVIDSFRALRYQSRDEAVILPDAARVTARATVDRVRRATAGLARPTVFWHVWDAPLITIGAARLISDAVYATN